MHTWLFHVINFQQIPKPAVLEERWFHFIQPPLVCSRDRSINNSAWIRLNLLQLGEQTQLRCPVWLRGALLHCWWRWKEVGSEEQLFLIAIIVYINRNQGWYLSKVTTYWKNLKHYFSTLGEKKLLKVWWNSFLEVISVANLTLNPMSSMSLYQPTCARMMAFWQCDVGCKGIYSTDWAGLAKSVGLGGFITSTCFWVQYYFNQHKM